MKRFLLIIMSVLSFSLVCPGLARAAETESVKELNFVFLHGMGGNAGSLQRLEDSVSTQIIPYIANYEFEHPDTTIRTDTVLRSYPNFEGIETWAQNIADNINERYPNKKNLVLIGHSMGGKTALYAVAHNVGNLADKVAMVVTINSPIKSLDKYYYVGGDTALDYWAAQMLISEKGVVESLVNHDSSEDGKWVSQNKHWLAFISAESAPLSPQFAVNGIDALPRDMDDLIVPISCQYADGADVVYYGEYGHSEFSRLDDVSNYLADQILRYIFGGNIECSVFTRGGSFEHKSGFLPGTDYWQDVVGGVLSDSGTVIHKNESLFSWQNWEDTVGQQLGVDQRSSFQTTQLRSFPLLTGLKRADWVSAGDRTDGRILLTTRAAPLSTVRVDWSVNQQGLLPQGIRRDHYEVELDTGTRLTGIGQVLWETNDPRDVRLRIWSQAEKPFRWFKTQWRVYAKETRQRYVIDDIPAQYSAE